ncbi:MAG: ATP-binding cassette domain-containing protein [Chlamydiales bacterium]|nr:ATP-binding cassette domain-containing protein [Chlamydiales bacterium]
MTKADTTQELSSVLHVLSWIFPHVWTMRRRLIGALLLVVVAVGISITIPYIFKMIIDHFSYTHQESFLILGILLCAYGTGWMMSQMMNQLRMLAMYKILERGKRSLSMSIVETLLSLSARFHAERQTGALTSSIEKAQNGFDSIFWGILLFLLPVLLELMLVLVIVSVLFGFLYGLAICGGILGYLWLNYLSLAKVTKLQMQHNETCAQATARIVDSLLNIETVKYFAHEMYESSQINQLLHTQEQMAVKRWMRDSYLQLGQMFMIGMGLLCATLFTGHEVHLGTISLGSFLLINSYLLQCIMPLSNINYIVYQVRKGIQDMVSVTTLLNTKPEIVDRSAPHTIIFKKPELVFDQVSFGYASERMVLKNISFVLPSGTTLAIVGSSGSGKSTIAKLIFRLYDVTSGCVRLDGFDIRELQGSFRKQIGIVPQDTILLNDTLYHNIRYGNLEASREDIYHAATLAQLDPLIQLLPKKYDTVVGERGIKLSGGEKQRIAIARLLLKKPSLYIFDEATSSLDSGTEREIQQNICKMSANSTTLIIAHRLCSVVHADKIIVLEDGQIIEQGGHIQLLQKNGLYSRMWSRQQQSEHAL